jgi:hypothetical protein
VRRPSLEPVQRTAAAALPRLVAAMLDVSARLSGGARAESPRRRLGWAAVAATLVLVPLVLTLARSSSFAASADITPVQVGPYPPISAPAYYRRLLADAELRNEMRKNVGGMPEKIDIVPTPDGSALRVTVEAAGRERAVVVVEALALQLANATRRQLIALVPRDVARTVRGLRRKGLTEARRRVYRRRQRALRALLPTPPQRIVTGPGRSAALTRPADRIVDAVPGAVPPRPAPAAAALSGLLLAVTLWALALVLFPPGSLRR